MRKRVCGPKHCENCPFRSRTVGSRGKLDASVVIVGESPGSTEVREGVPFIGPSGKLLDVMLRGAGIDTRDIYVTNAFKCLPPRSRDSDGVKKKDLAINDACRSCRESLLAEVSAHPRAIVLAMGNAAARSLSGQWNLSITRIRGQVIESPLAKLGVLPMFHPAHVLRNATLMPQLKSDFQKAAKLLRGKPFPKPKVKYVVLDNEKKVDWFVRLAWRKAADSYSENVRADDLHPWGRYLVADIETTGLDRYGDKFRCIGMMFADDARENGENIVYVVSGARRGVLLKRLFATINRDTQWVWHNGKFDTSFLRAKGLPRSTVRVDHDTMLLSYALDEIGGRHGLEQCIVDHLGLPAYKDQLSAYVGKGKKKKKFADVPKDVLYAYMADDVVFTALLFRKLVPRVRKRAGLWQAYRELLIPASNTLATIELNGMPIDQHVLKQSEEELQSEMEPIVEEMRRMVRDPDFNPNSPDRLLKVLRSKYGLKVRNTNKDTLKEYDKHPFVSVLLKYRAKQKLISTYIRPFMKYGVRVHTSYLIHGTVTGRLSSSSPNMQNIPKERIVRRHFKVPSGSGRCFIAIDYSQAELRSLAVLSGDEALMDIFRSGQDLHTAVAALVFGEAFTGIPENIPDSAIPGRMIKNPPWDAIRRKAKTINFGVVYGVTPPTLAERLGISLEEAEELVHGWFARFPKAKEFMDECRNAPLEGRPLTTVFGRQRRFYLITNANVHGIQNEAGNFPHQSMCSDFTLRAAIELDPILPRLPGNVQHINIVHDDNVFEIDDNPAAIKELVRVAKGVMEAVPTRYGITEITFEAEASKGYDWSAMEKLKDEPEPASAKSKPKPKPELARHSSNGRAGKHHTADGASTRTSNVRTSRRTAA